MSNVQIGDIALNDSLRMGGIDGMASRATTVRYLCGGGIVVQSVAIGAGQQIELKAEADGNKIYGYFTLAQINAIAALQAAGEIVTLRHHRGSWLVSVSSIEVEPIWTYLANPADDDKFIGTITMIIRG